MEVVFSCGGCLDDLGHCVFRGLIERLESMIFLHIDDDELIEAVQLGIDLEISIWILRQKVRIGLDNVFTSPYVRFQRLAVVILAVFFVAWIGRLVVCRNRLLPDNLALVFGRVGEFPISIRGVLTLVVCLVHGDDGIHQGVYWLIC